MLLTASIIMHLVLLRNTLQQNSVMVWGTPASLFKGKAEEEGRLFAVSNNSLVTPRDSLGRRKWSERSPLSSNKKVDHHCPLSDFTVAGPRAVPRAAAAHASTRESLISALVFRLLCRCSPQFALTDWNFGSRVQLYLMHE